MTSIFSLNIRFPKFIHVVTLGFHSFLCTVFYFLDIIQIFIHLSFDGQLGCFHLGGIWIMLPSTSMYKLPHECIVLYLGYKCMNGIAESNGNSIFYFLSNLHTVFYCYTILHLHQQFTRVQFLHILANLWFSVLIATLMNVRWYPISVFSCLLSMFSCIYWPFICFLWRNVYLSPLSIF